MGNCLRRNYSKVMAEDDKQVPPREIAKAFSTSHVQDAKRTKKRVRFRLQEGSTNIGGRNVEGNHNIYETSSGVVRIKLVVTQEELKQILSYKSKSGSKFSSLEQLLSEMKNRRGRSVLEAGRSDHGTMINGSWSPALESIPEDS